MSNAGPASTCPVFFCGTPKASAAFDTFLANVQKISTIAATPVENLALAVNKTKELDHGVVILLFAGKNDLVPIVNALVALKKRVDKGVIRAIVYSLTDLSKTKIPSVLKSKGCTEMLEDGLTQKALVHKLQRHIQIVESKFKAQKPEKIDEKDTGKTTAAKKTADQASGEKGKLKFVPALSEAADCWLVKNKRDFKYIRGNWIGEMIGPGPSAGAWIEAGGTKSQPVFRWTPRNQTEVDPFVGNQGSWFCSGRKPEFDWKVNRWRFIGETPSLFFKATEGSGIAFRFRSAVAGTLDIALNSAPAKTKLKAMIETFSEEKVFKDEKKKDKDGKEITQEAEKKKKAGAYGDKLTDDEEAADYGDKLTDDEDAAGWGELKEGEEEAEADWNDRQEEGEKKDPTALNDRQSEGEKAAEAALNDRQGEGEEEEGADWSGLDVGRGNKFNSGRGMGQGDGKGNKGYKYDKDGNKIKTDEDASKDPNDRTGEGEEEAPHDWSGLDVGRGNKFQSGGGLSQGQGGAKSYKYDKDGNPIEPDAEEGEAEEEEDLSDPFGLDMPMGKKKGAGGSSDDKKRKKASGGEDSGEVDLDLDNLLGNPAEDTEWQTGENAFEKITLEITIKRADAPPGTPDMSDVSLLERQGMDLLLDAPALGFKAGEKFTFAILLGQQGQKKNLTLAGILKSSESVEGSREIILVAVAEASKPHLLEIQNVFEIRQEQLLKFLREAKG